MVCEINYGALGNPTDGESVVAFLEDEIGTSENWLQSVTDNTAKLILNSRALLYDGGEGGSFLGTRRPWLEPVDVEIAVDSNALCESAASTNGKSPRCASFTIFTSLM